MKGCVCAHVRVHLGVFFVFSFFFGGLFFFLDGCVKLAHQQ